jgi:ArsR family transcriptional regulator
MTLALSAALRSDVAARFRALGDETRLAILDTLVHQGARNVGELAGQVGTSHANISKHLRVLLEAGLVARTKQGNSVIYSVDDPNLVQLCELACARIIETTRARALQYALATGQEA